MSLCTDKGSEWKRWDLHVHTASSFDYKYNNKDADERLCDTLRKNEIKAVAITDHFTIDKSRIENLRSLAPDIVFFPGVELRVDKGADNLHIILIFSENSNLEHLSGDFAATMIRSKAKSAEDVQKIHWTFEDVIDFAKGHDALVSIHAGRKNNGLDCEITSSIPYKDAIKDEIANFVHFFEIGHIRDLEDYKEKVFPCIGVRPLVLCSDCHSPNEYNPKESLWIKADTTFLGLKQCIIQPSERVFLGVLPPVIDRVNKNKHATISNINVHRVETPSNKDVNCFDLNLPLNPGLVAVIGNKGSGKSALSDIIALLCNCKTMNKASFLNEERFKKLPKNYAGDYISSLTWCDGQKNTSVLSEPITSSIEEAQYLPQKYIEEICNDINDHFQDEIDKVIFSYVDKAERGETKNLRELIEQKSKIIDSKNNSFQLELNKINEEIIKLEEKKTTEYVSLIESNLDKFRSLLKRHESNKPVEVKKPEKEEDEEYRKKMEEFNNKIRVLNTTIDGIQNEIASVNNEITDAINVEAELRTIADSFKHACGILNEFIDKYKIDDSQFEMSIELPSQKISKIIDYLGLRKKELMATIWGDNGFKKQLDEIDAQKKELISSADNDEKRYQKYLSDCDEWERNRKAIIGDIETTETLRYYENESQYLKERLETDYQEACSKRCKVVEGIFNEKTELVKVYESVYLPVQKEIKELLGNADDGITFTAEPYVVDNDMKRTILEKINRRFSGLLGRGIDAENVIDSWRKRTDFSAYSSVMSFIQNVYNVITEDFDSASKKVFNRKELYNYLFGLSYIGVNYKLKMGNRSLNELSPGERGIVLLVFYLALSKESNPIIIDQPEDNLDNQSVFSRLVPCIVKAKNRRQVIVVTHNPNIAVACDAEQIVCCKMDKDGFKISYEAGSIENPVILKSVIDVLEGTKPAFDLRRYKYEK